MSVFEYSSGTPVSASIDTVAGSGVTLKLKFGSGPGDEIVASPPTIARFRGEHSSTKGNVTTFLLEALAPGKATLTALTGKKPYGISAGPIVVNVLPKLVLPPPGTDAGLLARLFLAETLGPLASSSYNLADTKLAMRLMHVVVSNRLKTPSAIWGSAGAKSLPDVIRAPGQFAGFEHYPTIWTGVQYVIEQAVVLANEGSHPRLSDLRNFVSAALDEAAQRNPMDPSSSGLYWWRTGGSGAPAKTAHVYKTVSNNTFYMR